MTHRGYFLTTKCFSFFQNMLPVYAGTILNIRDQSNNANLIQSITLHYISEIHLVTNIQIIVLGSQVNNY